MGGWEHLKCKSANRSTELLCVVLYTLYFRKYIRTKVLCTFENGDDKGVPVATLTILATRVHVHVQRCTYHMDGKIPSYQTARSFSLKIAYLREGLLVHHVSGAPRLDTARRSDRATLHRRPRVLTCDVIVASARETSVGPAK